jgi:hypothetical protein
MPEYKEITINEPKLGFNVIFIIKTDVSSHYINDVLSHYINLAVLSKPRIHILEKEYNFELGVVAKHGNLSSVDSLFFVAGVSKIDLMTESDNLYFRVGGSLMIKPYYKKEYSRYPTTRKIYPNGEDYEFRLRSSPEDSEGTLTLYIAYKKRNSLFSKVKFITFDIPFKVKGTF